MNHIMITCSALVFMFTTACGTNLYEQFSSEDPAEAATVALDDRNPDKAIKILDSALSDDPDNYILMSLLASAKAQKAGVDTVDFALSMASSGAGGDIVSLFSVVPEASSSNLALLQEAIELLESIPSDSLHEADTFKLSMFYTTSLTLKSKLLDDDGDGVLSYEELLDLDESSAEDILQDLESAQNMLDAYSSEDGTQDAAGNIGTIADAIEAEEGSTTTEKLRNFLESSE